MYINDEQKVYHNKYSLVDRKRVIGTSKNSEWLLYISNVLSSKFTKNLINQINYILQYNIYMKSCILSRILSM